MKKLNLLFKILLYLSALCLLSNFYLAYQYHYVFDQNGLGYDFWKTTILWGVFFAVIAIGSGFCWRPVLIPIMLLAFYILKIGILELSGVQSILWPSISFSMYFRSDYALSNIDGFLKLIFMLASFTLLFFIGREWLEKHPLQKKPHAEKI